MKSMQAIMRKKTVRSPFRFSIVAIAFALAGTLAPQSWADKNAVPVEVKNKRNKPVHVRDSIVRHPVYCIQTVGNEHQTTYEFYCYKSVSRDRVETIPSGYSLVITDLMITHHAGSFNSGDRFNTAFGRMSESETSVIAPGILIRSTADRTIHKSFQSSPLIFHSNERFAALNYGEFTVIVSASGYLTRTSDLKFLF
jgi:hypothetical protein